jgi:hypothetical protein
MYATASGPVVTLTRQCPSANATCIGSKMLTATFPFSVLAGFKRKAASYLRAPHGASANGPHQRKFNRAPRVIRCSAMPVPRCRAKGWAEANDYMLQNSEAALQELQSKHYSTTPLSDIKEQFQAQKMFSSAEWKKYYTDGTVTKWLQQSTDFFMSNAGVTQFTPASDYFDPKIYLDALLVYETRPSQSPRRSRALFTFPPRSSSKRSPRKSVRNYLST